MKKIVFYGGFVIFTAYAVNAQHNPESNGICNFSNQCAEDQNHDVYAGADFVFEPDYRLRPLSEVELFITELNKAERKKNLKRK